MGGITIKNNTQILRLNENSKSEISSLNNKEEITLEKTMTNNIAEWRDRVTFTRAELLINLKEVDKPRYHIHKEYLDSNATPEDNSPSKEEIAAIAKAKADIEENEACIQKIEKELREAGIDPFKSAFDTMLFVDTESANCFQGLYKMCEYGQVVADTSLNEIEGGRKDLVMNPGADGKFSLIGRKNRPDVELAHSEKEYRHAPRYPQFHDDIAFFLTRKQSMVFLWAAENDIQVILDQCKRYELSPISFIAYDVQAIFLKEFKDFKGLPSLASACRYLDIDIEGIVQHRPDEDAYLTLLVLKGIMEKTGKSVMELIHDCPECQWESVRGFATRLTERERERAFLAEVNAVKEQLAPYHDELNKLLSMEIPEDTPLEKQFATSVVLKMRVKETLPLIKKWVEQGFYLRRNLNVAYLVAYDEEDKKRLEEMLDTSALKVILIPEMEEVVSK